MAMTGENTGVAVAILWSGRKEGVSTCASRELLTGEGLRRVLLSMIRTWVVSSGTHILWIKLTSGRTLSPSHSAVILEVTLNDLFSTVFRMRRRWRGGEESVERDSSAVEVSVPTLLVLSPKSAAKQRFDEVLRQNLFEVSIAVTG